MRLFSPELTSAILTALGIGGAWLATWLSRRGKKEDNRLAERGQVFEEVLQLAANRLTEITRLGAERDAAVIERERVRTSWEERWDRQMSRCREITDALVVTIDRLRVAAPPSERNAADEAIRQLDAHNERDHNPDD
jgi:hypothetical protein